jgi:hypothetical protein
VGSTQSNSIAKRAFAKIEIELCHHGQRLPDGFGVAAEAVRHFEQDAEDLARFLFAEPHQFVIEVDGFERLDEQRASARTGAVNDAFELAALAGDDRHDEALVAYGDELLLQDAFLAVGFEEAFERSLNGFLLALDIAADAPERHAGVVGHGAVGKNLAFEFL